MKWSIHFINSCASLNLEHQPPLSTFTSPEESQQTDHLHSVTCIQEFDYVVLASFRFCYAVQSGLELRDSSDSIS